MSFRRRALGDARRSQVQPELRNSARERRKTKNIPDFQRMESPTLFSSRPNCDLFIFASFRVFSGPNFCFRVQTLLNEPVFNLLAGPGGFPQERETGFDRRIQLKTADGNTPPHLAPTVPLDKLIENGLQRDAVQRIAWMRRLHWNFPTPNVPCPLRGSP